MPRKNLKIEVNNAVFSLPYHVAQEKGFFRDEGLDVELIPAGSGRDRDKDVPEQPIEDHRAVKSYGWHEGIEQGEFCMYRACEWGQIRRTQDSREGARVISKRAAVATQAIVVRGDSPYNVPADLHNVLVGVNMHAGSHYVTLALLEGYLKRHEIRPGHVGGPKQRLRFLEDGKLGAAALMEPWITVAVKRGHKIICEAFYEGAEVGVPSLDPEGYASVDRAIRRAVDSINVRYRALPEIYDRGGAEGDRRPQRTGLLSRQISVRLSSAVYVGGIRANLRLDGRLGLIVAGEPFRGHRRS